MEGRAFLAYERHYREVTAAWNRPQDDYSRQYAAVVARYETIRAERPDLPPWEVARLAGGVWYGDAWTDATSSR